MKRVASIATVFALCCTGVWILGEILSDRWSWSQWIAWIPTLVLLIVVVCATSVAIVSKSKFQSILLSVTACSLFIWFSTVENHLFTTTIKTGDLRIVSWTMSHSKKSSSFESAQELIRLDGDVTLLTHGWYVRGEPIIKEWLGSGGRKVTNGPFTLLTKQRVLNVQTLIASEGIFISMFEIDTTPTLGKTIVLWAIDLPSSFRDSKMEIAKRAKRLLDTQHAAPPDIVIGDFNMTRNSASIKTIFPNLHDASDQGGVGWLASYPMSVPLYHIDHVLVADSLRALSYRLLNPRIGRHRLQITELEIVD